MVARCRDLRQRGKLEPGGESEQSEAELMASLTAQGIDVDWLLSQRERVAAARRKQADIGATLTTPHSCAPCVAKARGFSRANALDYTEDEA